MEPFSPALLAKLPPELKLIVSRKVSDSNLNMDALLTTFDEELMARERANPSPSRRGQGKSHHTASTLFSDSQESKGDPQCCYCQKLHSFTGCTSITDIADQKQVLKTTGLCFNCLHRYHLSRECKSNSRCQKCKKKHHSSICDAGLIPTPSLTNHSESGLNSNTLVFQSNQTTSALCTDSLQAVFLQTAHAVICHSSDSHSKLEVRFLLDGGSQRSYISERA